MIGAWPRYGPNPALGHFRPGTSTSAEMIDREIAGVVWHQRGHRIEVIYVEGTSDHLVGTEAIAALLADDAGLALIDSPIESLRWTRGSVPRDARPGGGQLASEDLPERTPTIG